MKKLVSSITTLALIFGVSNLAHAKEEQTTKTNYSVREGASKEAKEVAKQIADLKNKAKNVDEYLDGLKKLGMKPEKSKVYKFKKVTEENGRQSMELLTETEYDGFYEPSNEVSALGGDKSDLTMWVNVIPGRDKIRGYKWITVDYYYEWDDTELFNGTDDGWVVNWDTEEAYADATGADSDISIVEDEIGGMGMEVEDDNERGNAWVILTPRDGEDEYSADGELTFEYAHTWGFDAPPISFSVSHGVVSIGSEIDFDGDDSWRKSGRSTY
jgi:hypothetical protein